IIIIKENIPKIKAFLEQEHISYEFYQEPLKKIRKPRPVKKDIFADYGKVLKDKELEAEKKLLEDADENEEYDEYEQEE
ncbi:5256_t:CDS:1, partial [Cetraspora pellucida]